MPNPYQLVAIDLDGTLLDAEHRISARNAQAVRALAARGVQIVIASGRMHEATLRYANELGLDAPIISYNGAMVKHPRTGEVWQHMRVPAEPAAEVIRFCRDNRLHLNCYVEDRLYIAERGHWAEFYLHQTGSPVEVSGDLSPLIGSEPTKLILIDTPETTERLRPQFQARFGDSLYITTTNPEYLEFMNPAANKGVALALVAERAGIDQARVLALGDGNNDIPMLEWAGLGIAMQNAKPGVQAAADRIAPSNEEDGLAIVLEELFGLS